MAPIISRNTETITFSLPRPWPGACVRRRGRMPHSITAMATPGNSGLVELPLHSGEPEGSFRGKVVAGSRAARVRGLAGGQGSHLVPLLIGDFRSHHNTP